MNQSIYCKYSMNQNMYIPFNEMLNDFGQIKPTFNPILDICTIKIIGGYIYNRMNFEKWTSCPKLLDEVMYMNENYNIKKQDIADIIKKGSSKYKDPSYTISEVSYYVSDCIKSSLDMNKRDDVQLYFEIKENYNMFFDKIKEKYQDEWDNIDKKYEDISNMLLENFSELENDLNFESTVEIIDSIGYEASDKVKQLIETTANHIKKNYIISSQIKIDFDNKMEKIYEDVVTSKKFDKIIHDTMLDMYGVEKAIHRMSLSLENCSNVLNMLQFN